MQNRDKVILREYVGPYKDVYGKYYIFTADRKTNKGMVSGYAFVPVPENVNWVPLHPEMYRDEEDINMAEDFLPVEK